MCARHVHRCGCPTVQDCRHSPCAFMSPLTESRGLRAHSALGGLCLCPPLGDTRVLKDPFGCPISPLLCHNTSCSIAGVSSMILFPLLESKPFQAGNVSPSSPCSLGIKRSSHLFLGNGHFTVGRKSKEHLEVVFAVFSRLAPGERSVWSDDK